MNKFFSIFKSNTDDLKPDSKYSESEWIVYESHYGKWVNNEGDEIETRCVFNIELNYNTGFFRLKTYGNNPEKHKMFSHCTEKIGKLNQEAYKKLLQERERNKYTWKKNTDVK